MVKSLCLVLLAASAFAQEPQFTKDNRLMKPADYRQWVFLSSGLGMTYGPARAPAGANPQFENVFVTPRAYKSFLATGAWPEGTMFVLEVRASETQGSIVTGGHYQGATARIQAEVKDSSRFPDKWAFFAFGDSSGPAQQTAQQLPRTAGCQACHSRNGAVENTFVQFYPTLLPVAKAKGTLKRITRAQ